MRKLKSYYVQIEKVKSEPLSYATYLLDKRRHRGEEILPLCDVYDSAKNLEDDKTYFHSKMKRGGHIPSSAYSLVISFPFVRTKEQWEKMNNEILDAFYQEVLTDILPNENISMLKHQLKRRTIAVVHKGNHCHYMLPKIIKEPLKALDYSKKRYMYFLKNLVNNYGENRQIFDNYRVDEKQEWLDKAQYKAEKVEKEHRAVLEEAYLSPLLVEIDAIIKGLVAMKVDGGIIGGLQKRRSTIEIQLKNGNTDRAEAQLRKAREMAKKAPTQQ